jgi:DNA-directed RNA polymerase subunit RPC12/RpoP
MNRYKKAAPSKESEGTYQMITCPVCGFKDATSDALTWTCPECEDKKEMKERVVEGVKAAIKNPLVNQALKQELSKALPKLEEKKIEVKQEVEDFMASMGFKVPEPPKPEIVREFKVGGLQCKIVKTGRE